MGAISRTSHGRSAAGRPSTHALVVALLATSVGVFICSLLVGCSSATTDPQAAQQARARASLTAGAQATQSAVVAASQTAAAIPLIPLPYHAAAPGPGCDTGTAQWTAQAATGVACLANPSRLQLTGLPDASGNCCQNEADWTFGLSGKLPATYRVSVQISGLLSQSAAAQLTASLTVNLSSPSGTGTLGIDFFAAQGPGGTYNIHFVGSETGFVSFDTSKPVTVAIEVSNNGASGLINGTRKLTHGLPSFYTPTGITLKMSGAPSDHADFANLSVEQV